MSDVVHLNIPLPPPTAPPASKLVIDETLLEMCAMWRAKRAEQQKNWAELDLASMYGTRAAPPADLSPLHQMQQLESHLADVQPRTMLLAREMLRMVVTILIDEMENPESVLADGPALKLVQNVLSSLAYCRGDMRIGPRKQ